MDNVNYMEYPCRRCYKAYCYQNCDTFNKWLEYAECLIEKCNSNSVQESITAIKTWVGPMRKTYGHNEFAMEFIDAAEELSRLYDNGYVQIIK